MRGLRLLGLPLLGAVLVTSSCSSDPTNADRGDSGKRPDLTVANGDANDARGAPEDARGATKGATKDAESKARANQEQMAQAKADPRGPAGAAGGSSVRACPSPDGTRLIGSQEFVLEVLIRSS